MAKSNHYRAIRKMQLYLPLADFAGRNAALEKLYKRVNSYDILHSIMSADLDWRQNKEKPSLARLTALVEKTAGELMLRKKRPQKELPHSMYHKIWRIVDGAVKDALYHHPDYLTPKGRVSARESIVKRATGAVKGFIER